MTGTFQMGSPHGEVGRSVHESRHVVTLTKTVLLRATEVTAAEFEQLLGYAPSRHLRCPDSCPVEGVSWHEAVAYCNALSRRAELHPCYQCEGEGRQVRCEPDLRFASPYECPGYRLPTEAEWEAAARAGTETATPGGELDGARLRCDEGLDDALASTALYCANAPEGGGALPVGSLEPNALGLYDMLGNVSEWCHDWYGAYPDGAVEDPSGPRIGSARVIRGGSWSQGASKARAAARGRAQAGSTIEVVGLRPARSAP